MFFRRRKNKRAKDKIILEEKANYRDLEISIEKLEYILGKSADVSFKRIFINNNKDLPVFLVFVEGLVDQQFLSDYILKPLVESPIFNNAAKEKDVADLIEEGAIYFASQNKRLDINEVINDVLSGDTVLVLERQNIAFTFGTEAAKEREITEPTGENVIKGAKDSFIENLRTNTATVRKKLRSPNLVIEETKVGKETLTDVALIYIQGMANQDIIEELRKRLDGIHTWGVLTSGIIEEGIIDNKYSLFPQLIYTERPDKFCSNIVEGRIGIMINGLPVTYALPATFDIFMQAPEEYSKQFIVGSIIRLLRYVLMLIALFLPGFYVSVTAFHQEMIPTELALAITASVQGTPFPVFIEVIVMLISFEVLTEAGLRLPKNIGQTISIVGAIVVGQAAVEAKLVSPAVLVVIAFTAISNFTMPDQDFSYALRVWRFVFVILCSIIGLFGLSLGGIILLHHLSKMEVYGVPYMTPFTEANIREMLFSVFRPPFIFQRRSLIAAKTANKERNGQDGDL